MIKRTIDKIKKQQKGITLIALVVTIIILLILAGVSIAMLTGNNGVLTQAKSAKENTRVGEVQEKVKLAAQAALTDNLGNGIEKEKFQEELNNMFTQGEQVGLEYDETNKKYTVTVDKYEVEVSNMGAVGEAKEATIQAKLTLTYKNTEQKAGENVAKVVDKNVPIPTNFYYVGGTKDTGVVISDNSADEKQGVDGKLSGNQFVWVPVNQNQKLQIDVTSKDDISSISLKDPFGEEKLTESNVGKTYNKKDQEPTINGTYSLTITTTTGKTKTTKLEVHSLYKQDFRVDETLNGMAESQGMSLEQFAKSMNFETVDAMIEIYSQSCKQTTDNDTNQESVNTYGGFYIARYEAGDGDANGTRRSSSSSNSNTVVSKKGAIVYNYISQPDSITRAESMYAGKSKLISGAGWDRTLNWLIETKAKTENEVFVNSSSWGNYNDSTGNAKTNSGDSNLNYTTGRNEAWKANNIYDLAGNVWDWTTEAHSSGKRVVRGGYYSYNGSNLPASVRGIDDSDYSAGSIGFRPALYL
jgi:flagellar basal body-associated protein FliL